MALDMLQEKLTKLRRKIHHIIIIQAISQLIMIFIMMCVLSFILDYFLIFSWLTRAVLLLGCGVITIILLRQKLIIPLHIPISDDDLVIAIEKHNPLLKERLISAFQFQRLIKDPKYSDSQVMTQKVIDGIDESLWQTDFDITDATQATWNTFGAIGIIFCCILPHIIVPNLGYYSNIWLKRNIFLQDINWPQRTYLMLLKDNFLATEGTPFVLKFKSSDLDNPLLWFWDENKEESASVEKLKLKDNFWTYEFSNIQNNFYFYLEEDNNPISSLYKIITTQTTLPNKEIIIELPDNQICKAKGQTLYLRVFTKGYAPRNAKVSCKFESGRTNSARLLAQDKYFFKHEFPSLMENFSFYFEGGYDVDQQPEYHLKVLNPPTTKSVSVWYQYPSYIGEQNTPWDKPVKDGNISAVVGTQIFLQIATNVELREGKLTFPGKYQNVLKPILLNTNPPVAELPQEPLMYYAQFTVQYDCRYQIDLQADNFLNDTNPSSFLIRAITDEAPFIQIQQPSQRNLRMLIDGTFNFDVLTTDDFGIAQLGLYYRLGNQDWKEQIWNRQQNDQDYPSKQIQSKMKIEVKDFLSKNAEGESITKETLSFKVYAKDNNTQPSVKESQTIAVIVLSRAEFLAWLQEKKRELAQQLRKVMDEQKENQISLQIFMAPDLAIESFDANRILQIKSNQNSISRDLAINRQNFDIIFENIQNNQLWNEFPQTTMMDIQKTLAQLSKEEANGVYQGESALIEQQLAEVHQQIRIKSSDVRKSIENAYRRQQTVIDNLNRIIPLLSEEDFNDVVQQVDQLRENQSAIREDLQRILEKK